MNISSGLNESLASIPWSKAQSLIQVEEDQQSLASSWIISRRSVPKPAVQIPSSPKTAGPAGATLNAASSVRKPDEDDVNSSASIAEPETLTLSGLRLRLECKSSQTDVKEFLANLRTLEEWKGTNAPSHQKRDAMLKVATRFGVMRKKDHQHRVAVDVAQDLEQRMLSKGRTMLRGSAAKPADVAQDIEAKI